MNQQQFSVCECQRRVQIHPVDPNLIHSSHIPSEAEISQVSELLEKGTQELEKCESKVAYLCGQLEEAEAEKRKLENHLASLRSISSTWRRVPVELWEHIFAFACCSSSTDGFSLTINYKRNFEKSTVTRFPVILSHVCSLWRSIVTGFPWLWSSISLELIRFPMGAESVLQMFLMNSAACPIVLRVSVNERGHDLWEDSENAWELLAPHFNRCKQLTLDICNYETFNDLLLTFRDLDVTFHDLSSLHLTTCFPRSVSLEEHSSFWEALLQAPRLADVHIYKPCLHDLLPYPRLTTLTIDYLPTTDLLQLLQILETSKNLRFLTLNEIQCTRYQDDIPPRQIELPLLNNLVIGPWHPLEMDIKIPEVLSTSLVMPSLSTFELTTGKLLPSPLLSMLQRTSMTLQRSVFRLNILSSVTFWPPLSPLLKMTPHLEHFELQDLCQGCPDHLILSLLSDLVDNTFLPALSSLILTNIRLNTDIVKGIVSLAASRSTKRLTTTDSVRGLKEICVVYINTSSEPGGFILEPQIMEEIKRLKRDGVKVVVEETLDRGR